MSSEEEAPEGNIQGRCSLITGVASSSHNRQAQILVGFTCSATTQSSTLSCLGDLEKNHFASLEVVLVHHAKSSVYDN